MRKTALTAVLAALLTLSACANPSETPASPTAEPVPTAAATAAPTPTSEPTPSPTPVPKPTATPEPRWVRGEESVTYCVLTKETPGSEALTGWLLREGVEIIAPFGEEDLGESMYTLQTGALPNGEDIPAATEQTRYLTLAADERLLQSGLLQELIPVFERSCGYSVEVLTAPAETAADLALEADVAILTQKDASDLRQTGAYYSLWPLASTYYVQEAPDAPEKGES